MGLFSFGNRETNKPKLQWTSIQTIDALEKAIASTEDIPGLFFKHSTRCSISSMALNRFENDWENTPKCQLFFIDLIAHREVSNKLSELSGVLHQSPQVIVIKNAESIYDASHSGINAHEILSLLDA